MFLFSSLREITTRGGLNNNNRESPTLHRRRPGVRIFQTKNTPRGHDSAIYGMLHAAHFLMNMHFNSWERGRIYHAPSNFSRQTPSNWPQRFYMASKYLPHGFTMECIASGRVPESLPQPPEPISQIPFESRQLVSELSSSPGGFASGWRWLPVPKKPSHDVDPSDDAGTPRHA